jgi:hypothetical protein
MEPWKVCWPSVADSFPGTGITLMDLDPHLSENSDPDSHQCENLDPHQSDNLELL